MTLLTAGDVRTMRRELDQLTNAALTAIASPGPLDDYGDQGDPVAVWEAAGDGVQCFLKRERRATMAGGVEVLADADTLEVLTDGLAEQDAPIPEPGATWDGWTVTVTDQRLSPPVTVVFPVRGVTHDMDHTLSNVVLELGEARPA